MNDEKIFEVVVKNLKSKDDNWVFFYGAQKFNAKSLIKKLKNDTKFREMVMEEIIKTAVNIFEVK